MACFVCQLDNWYLTVPWSLEIPGVAKTFSSTPNTGARGEGLN